METCSILFGSIEQINNFVHWAEKVPYDMNLSAGSVVIDAKSIQGIIAFGLDKELTLTIYGELGEDEKNILERFRR